MNEYNGYPETWIEGIESMTDINGQKWVKLEDFMTLVEAIVEVQATLDRERQQTKVDANDR